jgi:2-dehydro-3-deoxyphosphogluconate aldolase / (4S)-4-hydroxy-2-oxoglutarate aldolase
MAIEQIDLQHMNTKEAAIYHTKATGVLPAIKSKVKLDILPIAQAMYDGGARVMEVTTTSVGAFEMYEAVYSTFGDKLLMAAGTTLDAPTAVAAIRAGARVIVSPAVVPEVIATAHRYGVACYCGAFSATECLNAMQLGVSMIKIFPAALGGPKYMTNLKMVFPEINLIPSGGISLDTAGEFIRCGACAVSGARNFYDAEQVAQHGIEWVTHQTAQYVQLVAEAKRTAYELP